MQYNLTSGHLNTSLRRAFGSSKKLDKSLLFFALDRSLLFLALEKAKLLPIPSELPNNFGISEWKVTKNHSELPNKFGISEWKVTENRYQWIRKYGIFYIDVSYLKEDGATISRTVRPAFSVDSVDVDPKRVRLTIMNAIQKAVDNIRIELGMIK